MPTVYTAGIKDGMSFERFAMLCARAMGATVDMRDDSLDTPIPEKFEPNDYYLKEMDAARKQLDRLRAMSIRDAQSREIALRYEEAKRRQRMLHERAELKVRYEEMLAEVNAWKPPTEQHAHFKEFMISQLVESIKWDCVPIEFPPLNKQTGEEWLADQINDCEAKIARCQAKHNDEIQRTDQRNAWVKALRDSLVDQVIVVEKRDVKQD